VINTGWFARFADRVVGATINEQAPRVVDTENAHVLRPP
jgi:hypothetical protein